MNLRRQTPTDSLYMLLDTMCNAFGGIILLAVLVTLLTSKQRSIRQESASDSRDMLQRRLAMAESDLQKANQLLKSLEAKANDEHWKEQVSLLGTRQQIQDAINQIRGDDTKNAKVLDSTASADPAERVKDLNAQFSAAQAKKLAAQNSLAASKENSKRLSARLASMEKQATDLVNESQRQLRLPREHETGKRVVYVIARYGRVYLCKNSDLSRNETDIEWTSSLTREVAEPKPGKGLEPSLNAGALMAYFRNQANSSVYVAFCVFEDSFPAFIRARQLATETGLAYGWEPMQISNGAVVFGNGSEGHTPKPQ